MSAATAPSIPSKLSIVFAGEEHPAKIRTAAGLTTVLVRVRAMPARHLGTVLKLCTDEAALIDFVCEYQEIDEATQAIRWTPAPAGWADNLDDESHLVLLEAAKRQNFSRAMSWGERQIAAKEFQAPLLLKADEVLMPVIAKMVASATSSSPASAPRG